MNDRLPGLMKEQMSSGTYRYRVRQIGDPSKKIGLSAVPGDLDFMDQYRAARKGQPPTRTRKMKPLRPEAPPSEEWKPHITQMIKGAKYRSGQSGGVCELTARHVSLLIDQQGGRCAVSGIKFSADEGWATKRRPFVPSIDRIDNSFGYTPNNVRITCAIVNTAKSDWPEKSFLRMCAAVIARAVQENVASMDVA